MLECVANVSEGRDARVIDALAAACRPSLLDLHSDPDHNRSVFTLAGPGERDAGAAARSLADSVARLVSIVGHEGVHPRLGALDVVPFVALGGPAPRRDDAVEAAHSFARWWAETFEVPVFLYDDASPTGATLPAVRRDAFRTIPPDLGPPSPHPTLGATAVGARTPLVAVNCHLDVGDLDVAKRIASAAREAGGGLPGVRALGLSLASARCVQVSMNLVDLAATGLEAAVARVRELARLDGAEVARVEVVGLVPEAELARCSRGFTDWARIGPSITIEARLVAPTPCGDSGPAG